MESEWLSMFHLIFQAQQSTSTLTIVKQLSPKIMLNVEVNCYQWISLCSIVMSKAILINFNR